MAIFVEGSICRLCGKPMKDSERLVLCPPFVLNKKSRLWMFNDSTFHEHCFLQNELAHEVQRAVNNLIESSRPEKRVCTVCNELIESPDNKV